jgi:hypothetical protein
MRKAISLIELIFTILIIALVFTVIPKIVFALKKSDEFAIRQDAILNTISLMQMISKQAWDERNVNSSDILHVDSGNFECNKSSTYRAGGFVGSRSCENDINASTTFDDGESESNFDDVDDYNNQDINTSIYNIHTTVRYCEDSILSDLSNCGTPTGSTNLKRVHVKTTYIGKRGENKELMNFDYTSTNIGQFFIHKRVWE